MCHVAATAWSRQQVGKLFSRSPQGPARSLTIMFSSACLASQQLRNTGMNRFRRGGQKTCGVWGRGQVGLR